MAVRSDCLDPYLRNPKSFIQVGESIRFLSADGGELG